MTIQPDQHPAPIFSVAICTYNRANLLPGLLADLAKQTLPHASYEVLVIDNNSTDQTATIARPFCAEHANFRYIFEEKQGLSHARNRAWQEASGTYVAYTDDDCRVPDGWLTAAQNIVDRHNPVIFGGPYTAFYLERPAWDKDSYWSSMGYFGQEARWLTEHQHLSRASLFMQRELLQTLQGFNPAFGVSGEARYYGEETELQIRIRQTLPGTQPYYDPALCVQHLVAPRKLTIRGTMYDAYQSGRALIHLERSAQSVQTKNNHLKRYLRELKTYLNLIKFPWRITFGTLLRDRARYPYWQNCWYERGKPQLSDAGQQVERIVSPFRG